jgi:hypothetical protein
MSRLLPLSVALAVSACTAKTPATSDVAAVSSGITNYTVYIEAIDQSGKGGTPAYLPESQVNLLNGHSYDLYAALYTKDIQGFADGTLMWGSSQTSSSCLHVRTPVLKATDVTITLPLCEFDPNNDFVVDPNTTATISIDRDNASRQAAQVTTTSDAKSRADLISVCQPSAVAAKLPADQASLADQVQASVTGGSCTCGGWTIALSVFQSEFEAKGVDYAQSCADELAQETPNPVKADPATIFAQQCSPSVVAGFLPAASASLANPVRMDGALCSCGGWEISLSVFESEYLAKNVSYPKDCADQLAQNQPASDPVRDAFVASCSAQAVAGFLPSSSSDLASSVSLASDGQSCSCGGWTISQEVFKESYFGKKTSYARDCADQLALGAGN